MAHEPNDIKIITLLKKLQHFAIDFDPSESLYFPELQGLNTDDIETSGGIITQEDYSNYSFNFDLPTSPSPVIDYNKNGQVNTLDVDTSNYRILVSFLKTRGIDKKISEVFANLDLPVGITPKDSISDLINFVGEYDIHSILDTLPSVNRGKADLKSRLAPSIDRLLNRNVGNALTTITDDLYDDYQEEMYEVHEIIRSEGSISAKDFRQIIFDNDISSTTDPDQLKELLEDVMDYTPEHINKIIPFLTCNDDDLIHYSDNHFYITPVINDHSASDFELYYQYDSGHDKSAISPLLDKNSLETLYTNRKLEGGTSILDTKNNEHIWSVIRQHIENDQKIDENLKDLFIFGETDGEDTGKGFLSALTNALDYSNLPQNATALSKFLSTHTHQEVESLYLYLNKISKTKPTTPIAYVQKEAKRVLDNLLEKTPISFSIAFNNDPTTTPIIVDPARPDKSILESVSSFMSSNNAKSIDAILDDLENDELTFVSLPSGEEPSFTSSIKENLKKALLAVSDNPYDQVAQVSAFNYRPDLKTIVAKLPTSFFVWLKFTEQNGRKDSIREELQQYIDNGLLTEAESSHILNSHLIPKGPVDGNNKMHQIPNKGGTLTKALKIDSLDLSSDQFNAIKNLFTAPLSKLSMLDIELLSDDTIQSKVVDTIAGISRDEISSLEDTLKTPNILLLVKNKLDFFNGAFSHASKVKENPHSNKGFDKTQALSLDDHKKEHKAHSKELIPKEPVPKKVPPRFFKTPVEQFTKAADDSTSMTKLDEALSGCRTSKYLPKSSTAGMAWKRLKLLSTMPYVLSQDLLGAASNNKYGDKNAAFNFLKESLGQDRDSLISSMGSLSSGDENSTTMRIFEKISDVTGAQWSKDIVDTATKKNEDVSKQQMEALEVYIRNYKKIKYSGIATGTSPLTSETTISTDPSADPLTEITNLRDFSSLSSALNDEIKSNNYPKNSRRNLNNLSQNNPPPFRLLGQKPSIGSQNYIDEETKSDEKRDKNQRRNLIIAELQRERENMKNLSISPPKSIRAVLNDFRKAVNDGAFSDEEGKAILRSFAPEQTQIHSVVGNSFYDFYDAVTRPIENKRLSEKSITTSEHELSISDDPHSPKIILDSSDTLCFKKPILLDGGKHSLTDNNEIDYEEFINESSADFRNKLLTIDPIHLLKQVALSGNPESFIPHLRKISDHLSGETLSVSNQPSDESLSIIMDKFLKEMGIDHNDIDDFIIQSLPHQLSDLQSPHSQTNYQILKALTAFDKNMEPKLFNFKPSDNFFKIFNNRIDGIVGKLDETLTDDDLVNIDSIDQNSQLTEADKLNIDYLNNIENATGKGTRLVDLKNDNNPECPDLINLYNLHQTKRGLNLKTDAMSIFTETIFNTLYLSNSVVNMKSIIELYNDSSDNPINLEDDEKHLLKNGIHMLTLERDYPDLFDFFNTQVASDESISSIASMASPTKLNDLIASYPSTMPLVNTIYKLRDDSIIDLAMRAKENKLLQDIDLSTIDSIDTIIPHLSKINWKGQDSSLNSLRDDIISSVNLYSSDKNIVLEAPEEINPEENLSLSQRVKSTFDKVISPK